jgi:RHS repeat-associated protein
VDYLYDLSGHVISEVSASGGWNRGEVYAGGQHVATYDNGTTYFTHADWLGTERLRSNVAGAAVSGSNWTSYPFGEGSATPNPGPTHFTGKERDAESGLDYFGARYFASSMGRWMSPDWAAKAQPVPYAKLDNPQTLNLYQYMRNNPLSGADPDGHCDWCQKLWNGVTGNGFQTNAQIAQTAALNAPTTITETQVDKLPTNPQPTSEAEPKEPNGQVDLAASAAGVLSAAPGVFPGAPGLLLGLGAAGVSSVNDPSGLNLTINAAGGTLGVVSYAAEGTAVGTGAAVGGFGVAVGAMAWSASNWISTNVITPVFTPDANQSNTINANGVTIQAPDAYDWHQP